MITVMEPAKILARETETAALMRDNPALEAFLDYLAARLAAEYVFIFKQLETEKKG
jgi:hypothetical protein